MKNKLIIGLIGSIVLNVILVCGVFYTDKELKDTVHKNDKLSIQYNDVNKELDKIYLEQRQLLRDYEVLKEELILKDQKVEELKGEIKKLKSQ